MNSVGDNYVEILNNISTVTKEAGRDAGSVNLIAVSKTKPVSMLMEAYNKGCRDFGENYVQELCDKIDDMPADVRWHMIGHLQSNKVKYIVGKVFLIHSVDSVKLAREISKESVKKNVVSNILVEINVAGESSKFGTADKDFNIALIREISELPSLKIRGLMTIAPNTDNPQDNIRYFKELKRFAYEDVKEYIDGVPVLSMGMSGDYIEAIHEGATYVRVGSKIFGERIYVK